MNADKETIISAMYRWVAQRPGLEFVNYGDVTSYRAEMRRITRQRHDAEAMIRYCEIRDSITAEYLRAALASGRLNWIDDGNGGGTLDFCTCQHWPVEYRAAVCRVASSVIWNWLRDNRLPECRAEDIRAAARRELGASIARRWFN